MKNKDDENDLLIAKVFDKKKFCNTRNKITYTDFLNEKEQAIISKNMNLDNAFFYGGNENADRKILVFYPGKIDEGLARKSLNSVLSVLRIELPNEMKGEYEHRNYLSALIKIGIERSRIGDILVDNDGADIIIFNVNKEFIKQALMELTRFKKSRFEEIDIENVRNKIDNFEDMTIVVASMRIDNIVSELARCSRSGADEYIIDERVLVNYKTVLKGSKLVENNDVVTIRGKGKFIIDGLVRNTKNDRYVLKVRKYA